MKLDRLSYDAPFIKVIRFEPEQYVLSLSDLGDTEELLEDPSDYVDFFE